MGKRGPAPQPTKLKVLHGNPGKRPLNKREPKPKTTKTQCPARLSPGAKKVWAEVAADLRTLGLLTNVDRNELAKYCEWEALYRKELEWVHAHGTWYGIKGDDGKVKCMQKTPALSNAERAADKASRIAAKFGMTPSDRTALQVTGKEAKVSALEDYLQQYGQAK